MCRKEDEKMSAKRIIRLVLVIVVLFSSLAFTHSVSAGGGCGNSYIVQPGDWLAKIARRCGVTLSDLYTSNPWVGYYIYPGQVIAIPSYYTPGGYNPGGYNPSGYNYGGYNYGYYNCGPSYSEYYGNYYVVCRGDTLSGIAQYYGESLYYIQWRNHIANPNWIYAGQFIYP
jgi:LysM repeat protein